MLGDRRRRTFHSQVGELPRESDSHSGQRVAGGSGEPCWRRHCLEVRGQTLKDPHEDDGAPRRGVGDEAGEMHGSNSVVLHPVGMKALSLGSWKVAERC